MKHIDFIEDLGELAIGSRLKRLSEFLFEQVALVYKERNLSFEPKWFPVFKVLTNLGAQSILEIASRLNVSHAAVSQVSKELLAAGLISEYQDQDDKRKRILELSELGRNKALELEVTWKDLSNSITDLLDDAGVKLIEVLNRVEVEATKFSINERAKLILKERKNSEIEIIPFEEKYSSDFEKLNKEWITKYFYLEESDQKMLPRAKQEIIDKGGEVIFAKDQSTNRILGTCALKKHDDNSFELTKMAVTETAQGRGIGKKLALAMIKLAKQKKLDEIYLETNSKLTTAIELYRSIGFKSVPIPNPSYSRADVKMVLDLTNY